MRMNSPIVTTDWKSEVKDVLRRGSWRTSARTSASRSTRCSTSGSGPGVPPNRATAASRSAGMPVNERVPPRKRADCDLVCGDECRRCPRPHASRLAGDPEGRESALVGRAKVERACRDEVGRRGRRGPAVWVGQRVLDGESHVRGAQLGLDGSIHEADRRMDDALRVDDDLDGVVADIVQPVCLDDLQPLVGERRGVDRDLGSHRPRWMAKGGGRGRGGELGRGCVEERAT